MIEVGKISGNAIVPLSAVTKRTKWIEFTASEITASSGITINTVDSSYLRFAKDGFGQWSVSGYLHLDIDLSASSICNIAISGIVFKNSINQPILAQLSTTGLDIVETANTVLNSDEITIQFQAAITQSGRNFYVKFDNTLLESEPTTYTTSANMEASTDASIYIEPASATQSGLVNTSAQSFAGVKTFDAGVVKGDLEVQSNLDVDTIRQYTSGAGVAIQGSDGTATVAAGYVGETKYDHNGGNQTVSSGSTTTMASLSFASGGTFLITVKVVMEVNTGATGLELGINSSTVIPSSLALGYLRLTDAGNLVAFNSWTITEILKVTGTPTFYALAAPSGGTSIRVDVAMKAVRLA